MMPQEKYRCSFWKKLISPSHKSSIISSYAKSRRNAHPPALPATRREQRTTNNEQRTTQYFRARLRLTMAISAQQPPLLLGGADARRWIRRRLLSSRMPSPDNERRWFRPGAAGTVAITSAPFSLISATRPAPPSPSFSMCSTKFRWAFLESLSRTTRRRDGDRGSPWARRDRPGPGSWCVPKWQHTNATIKNKILPGASSAVWAVSTQWLRGMGGGAV